MSTQQTIQQKLEGELSNIHLDIQNESHLHNVAEGSESHFRVVMVSNDFVGMNLLTRHRTINKILKNELSNSIHALALHTFTPEEWKQRSEQAPDSPECRGGSAR